jgi:GT2 family glycosyltransferase
MVSKEVSQKFSMKDLVLKLLGLEYSYPSFKKELLYFSDQYKTTSSYKKTIDIVMPTFNRLRETKRTIDHLYKTTNIPFNLVIVDNNSSDDTVGYLKGLEKTKNNLKVIFLDKNLGGAGSRIEGLKYCSEEYVAFLDNDILTMNSYFENMINTLEANKDVSAVHSKVVLPNGLIQINRPYIESDEEWVVFYDKDIHKRYDEQSTLKQEKCPWIPIGATMWRRSLFDNHSLDKEFGTLFEDNEFSYRLNKEGVKFMNCPGAICLHVTSVFAPDDSKDKKYVTERFSYDTAQKSAKLFFKKHGLIFSFGDPVEYVKTIGFQTVDEYTTFLRS